MWKPARWTVAIGIALAVGGAPPVRAQDVVPDRPDCSTPRKAVLTWLGNLQGDRLRPMDAATCFEWESSTSAADRETQGERLKRVLDARGLWVEMEALPDTPEADGALRVFVLPDVEQTEDGARVVPTRSGRLPEVFLVRRGERWLISARTIDQIDSLYAATFSMEVEGLVERLPAWMHDEAMFGVAWWQVLALFLLILLGFVVRAVVAFVVRNWVGVIAARAQKTVGREFVAKMAAPVGTVAMAGVLWYFLPLLRFGVRVNQLGNITVRVLAAVSAVIVLYRLVDVVADVFARKAAQTETKLDDQLVPLLRRTVKVFVVVLGVLFVLQNLNVDITSLLAIGTVGTLAFSLAAKDTAGNLFGSVSIFADRPFQVGDWIVIGDIEGVVEEVGMRSTRIRTFYNSLVTLPNSAITVTAIDNFGARRYRRTSVTLGVTYSTSPEQIEAFCNGVRAILQAHPQVRKDAYEVHFKAFGASSLDIMLYFFFECASWSEELRARHVIYLEILRLARELGVEFAFPTQTLHLASVAEPAGVDRLRPPDVDALRAAVRAFGPGGSLSRPGGPDLGERFYATTLPRGADSASES